MAAFTIYRRVWLVALLACLWTTSGAAAQEDPASTSSFTYQGEIKRNDVVVNSTADLRFRLYDSAVGGTQIGSQIQPPSAAVLDGRFTVVLDFGTNAFNGQSRYLEIDVRSPAGSGIFQTLSPRQILTAVPYALFAMNGGGSGTEGPVGPAGPMGPQGPQGIPGAPGQAGSIGPMGPMGPMGPAGNTGTQGPAGPSGPAGAAGASPFVLAGTSAYYLTGNVGIGTNTPQYLLHVETAQARAGYFASSIASGAAFGVLGRSASSTGVGVVGYASSTSGAAYGVQGQADSTTGRGVYGWAAATTGGTYGVSGRADSPDGIGTSGYAAATTGAGTGVLGEAAAANDEVAGVYGLASATTRITTGVWGLVQSTSAGASAVYGLATGASGETIGVYGANASPAGYGMFSDGDFASSGNKQFVIDHPLDPANRALHHYTTEGPAPFNTYRGNVVLDGAGEAVVSLPAYFESINSDPTYQLTAVGGAAPSLHVASTVSNNQFRIAGGTAGLTVSWQVTALRNDAYMRAHPALDDVEKSGDMKGRYYRPELFNAPASTGFRDKSSRTPAGTKH